jgi:hypothetical protein
MNELNQMLKNNLPLHMIIENEVRKTPFGQITVNVELINGVAKLETLNIVKNKRIKYDLTKNLGSDTV